MNVTSADKSVDFLFQNHPVDFNKMHSKRLIEESREQELPYGHAYLHQWNFDGIRILHNRHKYKYQFLTR